MNPGIHPSLKGAVSQNVLTCSPAGGDCVKGVHGVGQWEKGRFEKSRAEICWGALGFLLWAALGTARDYSPPAANLYK